jgi:iron(III) transport system substrate-binding protein
MIAKLISLVLATSLLQAANAQELNLYTARHYQTDEALYTDFTKKTGIKINRIEASEDQLLERLKAEGGRSPADVFLTVDAGRLAVAESMGLFEPIQSKLINDKVAANYRLGNGTWLGLSTRARVILVDKTRFNPSEVANYEDLANPKFSKQICVRSGSHVYNLSLIASLIEHLGVDKTEAWAKGVVANLARAPKGGDTDQIKALGAGECSIALANSYYVARLLKSTKPEDKALMSQIAIVMPNQSGRGTHMNVAGGGVLKHAPNKAAALAFMEYLVSDSAQTYFADGNNEWPVVASLVVNNPALASFGSFKQDSLNIAKIGAQQAAAQALVNRVGWK